MLKIQFESPNVIDPGEQPPPRRTHLSHQGYSDNPGVVTRERPNYTDNENKRQRFKSTLGRTEKLSLPKKGEADEKDQDSDNMEEGVTIRGERHHKTNYTDSPPGSGAHSPPGSPATVDARVFAATMLAETERRASQRMEGEPSLRSSSSMQWPRRSRRHTFQEGLRDVPQYDEEDLPVLISRHSREGILRTQNRRRMFCIRTFIVSLVLSIIICFSILAARARKSSPTKALSQADAARLDMVLDVLVRNRVSKRVHLEDQSSPQYKAAHWIAIEDAQRLDIAVDSDQISPGFKQRYILAVLYFSWNGPKWNKQLNFMSDLHECSWFELIPDESGETFSVGVTCDKQLEVRNLVLSSNNLEGQFPEEIIHLTKLDFLNLKDNNLTGSIPRYLKNLPLLDFLDLKYNQLTGTIPDFLGELTRLEVLGLSHNQLTGRIPTSIGSLPLKTLAIDENLLTGDLSTVALMTNLRYVYADNNRFNGQLDNGHLADLAHLVEVDLSGNEFEAATLPRNLFLHPVLRVLDLHGNKIAGSIPENIPENNALTYLSLRDNALSSSIPTQISHLRALTHLDLEGNSLTGTLPAEELAQMTKLSYLFLGKNSIQPGTIPDAFRSLKSLRELSLDALQLTGPMPIWMENLSRLKLLDLRSNELTGKIPINFSNLAELVYLMLNDNLFTGPVPEGLGSRPQLLVAALHHNNFTGEAGQLCESATMELLTTDCGDITCPCCDTCCDSTDCYEDAVWDALENSEGVWEEKFERSTYGFNPHILFTSREPNGKT